MKNNQHRFVEHKSHETNLVSSSDQKASRTDKQEEGGVFELGNLLKFHRQRVEFSSL